jgi:hypothetical protein
MSASGSWYVVKFTNEKYAIESIPKNWFVNFKKCLLPHKLDLIKLQSAIKNQPSDD